MNTQIIPFEANIQVFAGQATGIQVIDQASLAKASEALLVGKHLEKTIRDYFAPLKQNAHVAWKAVCDLEKLELSKVTPKVDRLSFDIADYRTRQERKRREAEEAAHKAEAEKKRLEEEALGKAQEAEMRAKAAKNEEARKKAQAEADAIIAKAAEEETKIAPVPVIPETIKSPGLSMRDNWDFEIADESLIPREYLIPDDVKIRRIVKAMKDKTDIAGIKAVNRPIMARASIRI